MCPKSAQTDSSAEVQFTIENKPGTDTFHDENKYEAAGEIERMIARDLTDDPVFRRTGTGNQRSFGHFTLTLP